MSGSIGKDDLSSTLELHMMEGQSHNPQVVIWPWYTLRGGTHSPPNKINKWIKT